MKVLLSGSTGVLGQELGKSLVDSGHQVVALTRDPRKAEKNLTYPAEIWSWNVETPLREACLDQVEAVIHLAGEGIANERWNKKRKQQILSSRVLGTRNIVQGVRAYGAKVRTFISASGISYYGFSPEPFTERSSKGHGFLANVCEQWEAELHHLPAEIRNITFRIAPVLTKTGGFLGEVVPLFLRGFGARLGSGEQLMSWIHIEDWLAMIHKALNDSAMLGVYNASANVISNTDFTMELCRVLRVRPSPPVPGFVLRGLYGEMSDLLLESQGALSERYRDFRFRDFTEALISVLGAREQTEARAYFEQWVPVSREDAVRYFEGEESFEEQIQRQESFHVVKKWRHGRRFETLGRGTLVVDDIFYRLPLGLVGRAVASSFVKHSIQSVFNSQRDKIFEKFGGSSDKA